MLARKSRKLSAVRAAEASPDKGLRLLHCPARQQAGMDHGPLAFDMKQRLRAQPQQEFVPVGGAKYVMEGVLFTGLAITFGLHQQMQVVVAEDHRRARA
jgi:hypothetical protein